MMLILSARLPIVSAIYGLQHFFIHALYQVVALLVELVYVLLGGGYGRFLAGDVKSVSGATARVRDWTPPAGHQPAPGLLKYSAVFEIPDTTALVMQYQSGALGTLSCSLVPQKKWDVGFKVVADGLLVTLEGANATWTGDEEGSLPSGKDWPNYVLNEFIEAVKTGGKTSVPYAEGVKSLAISIAGYESVKKGGRPVELAKLIK